MTMLRILTVFALFFGASSLSFAETLDMDGMSPEQSSARPTRGMTAASVESKFGTPQSKDVLVYRRPDEPSWGFDPQV